MYLILNSFLLKYVFSPSFVFLQLRSSSKLLNLLSKMPKEPSHTAELKNQRLKLKEKSKKYAPGTVSLKILGSGAKGSTRALYVFTDQTRYMFNCGEGTQRLAHEHKMKLTKLEHIFVTHKSWENIGGLLGLALTIQDAGVPEIQLHGPPGTNEIFQATRRFVVMKDLTVNMKNCLADKVYEDNIMTVKYIPLVANKNDIEAKHKISEPESTESLNGSSSVKTQFDRDLPANNIEEDDEIDYYAYERKRSKKSSRSQDRKRFRPNFSKETLEHYNDSHVAMSYICRLKPRSGTLNLEKCVEKGVPPGPLLGRLKSGEDVELEDGTIVMSQEVCDPDEPGAVFLVVECPSLEYIDSFVSNKDMQMHQAAAVRDEDFAYIVVHFTPQSVMDDVRYKKWMEAFSLSTSHIILNDSSKCSGSAAVHKIQHKLNILHPQLFPLLKDSGILLEGEMTNVGTESSSVPIFHGRTLYSVNLRPKKSLSCDGVLKIDPKDYVNETMCVEGFPEVLSALKEKLKCHPVTNQEYPRILFLGTGSCVPNKIRNTSSIILEISETELLMMDCGEGTLCQMTRFYGQENVDAMLCKLKGIYISHLHADHHLGLVGLIKGRRKAMNRKGQENTPLFLMAPHQIMTWLNFYHRNFEEICHEFKLVPNFEMLMNNKISDNNILEELKSTLGMTDISTAFVNHCPNAFGVAFRHHSGWKITYSGDTMPSPALVNLGKNTDLLIHEATMEDELEDEAKIKMHSTTSQAIKVGQEMGAKFTLLTHFSQRYAKLPRFNDNFSSSVGIAFDNMLISLKDLHVLPLLYHSLKIMFAEDYEELEQRALRRQRRLKTKV